jgi:hypothetical protein
MGTNASYVSFGRAAGWEKKNSATCLSLYDPHGAGAQRSDPKVTSQNVKMGTNCSGNTAYGLGPQGDTQRGMNLIRLVRDTNQTGS